MATVAFENHVSVPEAAEIIGCTTGRVHQLIADGTISGEKVNGRAWLLLRKDVERIAKKPRTTGRPRVSQRDE